MDIHFRCVYSRAYHECGGVKKDETWDSSSPWQKNLCGSITPCRTSWVLPFQKECQCQDDALPWKVCTPCKMEITSPGLIQITEWMFKSCDCENAITSEFILLDLSYFPSFRLIYLVLAQPDMSNTSPNKLFHSQLCFPSIFAFCIKSLCQSPLSEGYILFFHFWHIYYWFPCCYFAYP